MIATAKKTPTTDMQVTSIRLETELKERLRLLSGNQGYQSLIRDILWEYVERNERSHCSRLALGDLRATIPATAQKEEVCELTGAAIAPHSPMLLGLTLAGKFVPVSIDSVGSRAGVE